MIPWKWSNIKTLAQRQIDRERVVASNEKQVDSCVRDELDRDMPIYL